MPKLATFTGAVPAWGGAHSTARPRLARAGAVALAVLAGLLILSGVAFAPAAAVHSAAHDTRHAFAFPCH